MDKYEIIVIGAGTAGLAAAQAAAKQGKNVYLIGAEPLLPYWRPMLPKVVSQQLPVDKLYIQQPKWFAENNIKCDINKRAVRIDFTANTVVFQDGSSTSYDKLILAMGSKPFIPPFTFEGKLLSLRTYEDAIKIRESSLLKKKVVMIGGGLLSLEVAFEILKLGIPVTILELSKWLLPRQLDQNGGNFLIEKLKRNNLNIITGIDVSKNTDLLKNACIIVGAGTRPDLEIIKDSEIKINRCIVVDKYMKTSIENVYACGDVVEYQGKCWGLIQSARQQGQIAGLNASGKVIEYEEFIPSPMLSVGGLVIMSMGNVEVNENNKFYSYSDENSYNCFVINDNKLIGSIIIGDASFGNKCKKLIEQKTNLPNFNSAYNLKEAIGSFI